VIAHVCFLLGVALMTAGLLVLLAREAHLWRLNHEASDRLRYRQAEDELGRMLRKDAASRVASRARVRNGARW